MDADLAHTYYLLLCHGKTKEWVTEILKRGMDPNYRDGSGYPVLMEIEDDLIETLVKGGADVNAQTIDEGNTALMLADSLKRMVIFLEQGADTSIKNKDGNEAIHLCVHSLPQIRLLVAFGANIEAKNGVGKTPLQLAQENRHTDVVEYLLKQGAKL